MSCTDQVGQRTPWGESQAVNELGPGIVFHNTASHGGIHLSQKRQAELSTKFYFPTFAGGSWYEEDEDACAVVIAFPDFFDDEALMHAVRYAQRGGLRWKGVKEYLQGPGEHLTLRALGRAAETADHWRIAMLGTSGGNWSVTVRRGPELQEFELSEYPTIRIFSNEEVEQRRLAILKPEDPPLGE